MNTVLTEVEVIRDNNVVEVLSVTESVVVAVFTPREPEITEIVSPGPQGPRGLSGGSIESTTNILEGDGAGNAEDSGVAVADLVLKASGPTPGTLNEVIALLQAAGLCS